MLSVCDHLLNHSLRFHALKPTKWFSLGFDYRFSLIVNVGFRSGISFLSEKSGLPKHTFLSFEAVHWAIDNIEGIDSVKAACDYFEVN